MLTIYDFLPLYATEDDVQIYDFSSEEIVFAGDPSEAMDRYGDCEVESFDVDPKATKGTLIINTEI